MLKCSDKDALTNEMKLRLGHWKRMPTTDALVKYACRTYRSGLMHVYDVLPVIAEYGVHEGFSHISTGHRAFFECLKGKSLPGIEALL